MKTITLSFFIWFITTLHNTTYAQMVQNGSFENASGSDLSPWLWICGAIGDTSTPAGGGNWSIKVNSGNFQGCFPGFAFQKLPGVSNGDEFILNAWSKADISPYVGIYFGRINNNVITRLAGDSTSSNTWTGLSRQSTFTLGAGDTAVIVLWGGQTGGPVQGYGFFDLVELQSVAGMDYLEGPEIPIYPNPASDQLHIRSSGKDPDAFLLDNMGRLITTIELEGELTTVDIRSFLPGLYFLVIENKQHKIIID